MNYFLQTPMSVGLAALFTQRVLIRLALQAFGVFAVVFLYEQLDSSLTDLLGVFALLYASTAALTPVAARLIGVLGIRTLIACALPALVGGVGALYFLASSPHTLSLPAALIVFVVSEALYRALYWVPYQIDMARLSESGWRGRQLATLENGADILVTLAPFVGGYIVATTGFSSLFLLGAGLICVALIPLGYIPTGYDRYTWSYQETFRQLVHPRNQPLVISHLAEGIQSAMVLIAWPLAVYLIIGKEYVMLGAVATFTLLIVLVTRAVTGSLFDRWNKRRILLYGAIISAGGWVLKIFVGSPFQVVIVDGFHGIGRTVHHTSIEALTYEQAADSGRYIDEYTVLKEIALNAGRVVLLCIVGIVYLFVAEVLVAIMIGALLAAGASVVTSLLSRQQRIVKTY